MAVAAILETLDDVPDALKTEYRETEIPNVGTRFVLDVAGIDTHPTVRNLKTAHDRVKLDRDGLRANLDTLNARVAGLPDDFDPADYDRLRQAEADGKGPKVDERLAEQRKELEKKRETDLKRLDEDLQGRLKERNARVDLLYATVERSAIDDGLIRALVEAGVDKAFLGAAKALLKDKGALKLVEDEGRFSAIAETDSLGPLPLSRYVQEWANSEEGRAFIPKPTGGDARGGNARPAGENPFRAETWDVTRQGQILREKGQDHAERLAKAAGTTLGGPRPTTRAPAP